MSGAASAPTREDLADIDDYDRMLSILEELIETGREKIVSGRIYDENKEKVRQRWIRETANAIDTWRKMKADRDLEELRSKVSELEGSDEP